MNRGEGDEALKDSREAAAPAISGFESAEPTWKFTPPTRILESDKITQKSGVKCPKCDQLNDENSLLCRKCKAELGKRKIVDMRHTLDSDLPSLERTHHIKGMDSWKVKTSYQGRASNASANRDVIQPIPTPFIQPPALGANKEENSNKYNIALSVSFIVLLIVIITVLALLIAKYV